MAIPMIRLAPLPAATRAPSSAARSPRAAERRASSISPCRMASMASVDDRPAARSRAARAAKPPAAISLRRRATSASVTAIRARTAAARAATSTLCVSASLCSACRSARRRRRASSSARRAWPVASATAESALASSRPPISPARRISAHSAAAARAIAAVTCRTPANIASARWRATRRPSQAPTAAAARAEAQSATIEESILLGLADHQSKVLADGEILLGYRPQDQIANLVFGIRDTDRDRLGLDQSDGDLQVVADQETGAGGRQVDGVRPLVDVGFALGGDEVLNHRPQLLQHLRRHRPLEEIQVLLDRLLDVRLDLELRLRQPQRRQEDDLELGHRRNHRGPANEVIRPHERQPLADHVGQILLGPSLEQARSDHERRNQLGFLPRVGHVQLARRFRPQIELRLRHAKHLIDVVEYLAEEQLIGGDVAPVLALEPPVLVLLGPRTRHRVADGGEDVRDEAIFVGVIDALPEILGEARLGTDEPLGAVLLEELLLLGIGLAQERHRRGDAPGPVVLLHGHEEAAQRLEVDRHLAEVLRDLDEVAVFLDGLVVGLRSGELVELGKDLVARGRVRIQLHANLERSGRGLEVLEARPVDLAEAVPEGDLRRLALTLRLLAEALDHLPEVPLLVLPVLLGGHHLVDALEGLEIVRILVERLVVELDRLVGGMQLVVGDIARRDQEAGLDFAALQLRELHEDLHRLLPLLGLAEEVQEVVQELAIGRLEIERLEMRRDRLLRVGELVLVDLGDLFGEVELVVEGRGGRGHHGALLLDDRLEIARLGVEVDQGLQGRAVPGLDLQRLLEHVDRLGALVELELDAPQAEEDVDDLVVLLRVAVVDQDGLVDPEGIIPVLEAIEQPRPVDQRRQIGRIEVVGLLVVLERLFVLAETIGGLGEVVVKLRQLAVGLAVALAREHLEDGDQGRPFLALEVDLRERLGRLDMLGIELQDPREEIRGLRLVVELVLKDLAGLVEQAGLLERVAGGPLGANHELRRLLPVAAPLVDAQQRQHRRNVRRILRERLDQILLGGLRVLHLLVEHLS